MASFPKGLFGGNNYTDDSALSLGGTSAQYPYPQTGYPSLDKCYRIANAMNQAERATQERRRSFKSTTSANITSGNLITIYDDDERIVLRVSIGEGNEVTAQINTEITYDEAALRLFKAIPSVGTGLIKRLCDEEITERVLTKLTSEGKDNGKSNT